MDDSSPAASIILYFVFLLIDVFFYGFGEALDSLNEKEVERKAEEDKDKKSVRLKEMICNPAKYDNTAEMITTLVNVIIGAMHLGMLLGIIRSGLTFLAEKQLKLEIVPAEVILVLAAVLSTLLLLYITLTLGVLLPKKIAERIPEKWAYACITPVFLVTNFLAPFTGLVTLTVKGILRVFGYNADSWEADVTEEEIINMVNEGHEQGLIQASEAEMISNIFEFGDKEVQDIMTHRNSIVAIDSATTLQEAITFMIEGKKSRYPVYEENIDNILGILHFKDAVRFQRTSDKENLMLKEINGLMREACFVPQTKHIDELFREMQAEKLQMVVVVDEYGQTDGLVAMEDILEEIVGNILDEYDDESEYIEEKSEDEYIIDGMTPLEELEDRFDISFEDEEFETLNGFLISRMDRIPEPDEQFDVDYQGYNFKIISVENKMIQSVLVTKLPEKAAEEESIPAEKSSSREE
ncbi:MAG: hemolysin family protein [Acetatifactor sp.]